MSGEMIPVVFHGDTLHAVRDPGGKVWVSLRRCCENLGLAFFAQLRKMKSKPWACVTEIVTHDSTGRSQAMAMIELDALPMWLATIDARKVDESLREKLALYQKDAARVLADHFFGRRADAPPSTGDALLDHIEAMAAIRRSQLATAARVEQVAGVAGEALDTAKAAFEVATNRAIPTGTGKKVPTPRAAVESLLGNPVGLAAVLAAARTKGGAYLAISAATGASKRLIWKMLLARGLHITRVGDLVPLPLALPVAE